MCTLTPRWLGIWPVLEILHDFVLTSTYVHVHEMVWIVSLAMAWCVNCELTQCSLFPCLKKAVYLDCNIFVQHDIHDF